MDVRLLLGDRRSRRLEDPVDYGDDDVDAPVVAAAAPTEVVVAALPPPPPPDAAGDGVVCLAAAVSLSPPAAAVELTTVELAMTFEPVLSLSPPEEV